MMAFLGNALTMLSNRKYETAVTKLSIVETYMDLEASYKKTKAWLHGWWRRGFAGAHDAAFGLLLIEN